MSAGKTDQSELRATFKGMGVKNLLINFIQTFCLFLDQLDEEVARLHLDHLGVKMTTLTAEQSSYLGVEAKGPYKPDHYRY